MKKRGISLIVLVITIIVMIILAAAIIISLNNTGIIGNANKAVEDTNLKQIQEMAQVAWLEGIHAGKTGDELTNYVMESLKKNGFESTLDKYKVEVTDEKVEVNIKIPLGSISLNASNLFVIPGVFPEYYQLNVIYSPENTNIDKKVTWKSSNESVAFVDSNGKIKSGSDGKATITATVEGKEATCVVNVFDEHLFITQADVHTSDGNSHVYYNTEDAQSQSYITVNTTGTYAVDALPEEIEGLNNLAFMRFEFADNIDYVDFRVHCPGVESGDMIYVRQYVNGQWIDLDAEAIEYNTIRINIMPNGANVALVEVLK